MTIDCFQIMRALSPSSWQVEQKAKMNLDLQSKFISRLDML